MRMLISIWLPIRSVSNPMTQVRGRNKLSLCVLKHSIVGMTRPLFGWHSFLNHVGHSVTQELTYDSRGGRFVANTVDLSIVSQCDLLAFWLVGALYGRNLAAGLTGVWKR
jgi:hypothetical protein